MGANLHMHVVYFSKRQKSKGKIRKQNCPSTFSHQIIGSILTWFEISPQWKKKLFISEPCVGKWNTLSMDIALHYKELIFLKWFPIPDFFKNIQSLKKCVYRFIVYKVLSYTLYILCLSQLPG